ncbi:MAG: hypothetical protein QNJ46_17695 [Leptolyngbyaceae cyanobacterium MO_188.B28]|nr:hypothetical protein [Leptolyngbyaceae cyanobacterium MO_188.B28]
MNPELARPTLRAFLESQIRIDKWGLNFPDDVEDLENPPSIAREEPLADLSSENFFAGQGGPTPVTATLRCPYTIIFRFSSSLQYHQLPIGEAETNVLRILSVLQNEPYCVHEHFEEIAAEGRVVVAEAENRDWLITYQLTISPTFLAELLDLIPSTGYMAPLG